MGQSSSHARPGHLVSSLYLCLLKLLIVVKNLKSPNLTLPGGDPRAVALSCGLCPGVKSCAAHASHRNRSAFGCDHHFLLVYTQDEAEEQCSSPKMELDRQDN